MRSRLAAVLTLALVAGLVAPLAAPAGAHTDGVVTADAYPVIWVATNAVQHLNPWRCDRNVCQWDHADENIVGWVPIWDPEEWWFKDTETPMLVQPWVLGTKEGPDWVYDGSQPAGRRRPIAVTECHIWEGVRSPNCRHRGANSGWTFIGGHRNIGSATLGLHNANRRGLVGVCIDDPEVLDYDGDGVNDLATHDELRDRWIRRHSRWAERASFDSMTRNGWTREGVELIAEFNGQNPDDEELFVWHPFMGSDVLHPVTGHGHDHQGRHQVLQVQRRWPHAETLSDGADFDTCHPRCWETLLPAMSSRNWCLGIQPADGKGVGGVCLFAAIVNEDKGWRYYPWAGFGKAGWNTMLDYEWVENGVEMRSWGHTAQSAAEWNRKFDRRHGREVKAGDPRCGLSR